MLMYNQKSLSVISCGIIPIYVSVTTICIIQAIQS